jgi:2,5-diamino-6-(ribosylamino)-4(3H)-pyrimidinone 5'-phosphate reductase
MLPKVIIHNSISLDGSLVNFVPNMELHYTVAARFKPDAYFVGSNTVKVGIQMYENGVPAEEEKDFSKPNRDKALVYWFVPDSGGTLKGLLHVCRRFEYCKDVIVLVAEQTPCDYIKYLKERNYDFLIAGKTKVDLKRALELIAKKYAAKTVVTDAGRVLSNLLLEQRLASAVSLLIHPSIVGREPCRIFDQISERFDLTLKSNETLNQNYVWLIYAVNGSNPT